MATVSPKKSIDGLCRLNFEVMNKWLKQRTEIFNE